MKSEAWIHHGMTNHSYNQRLDCLDCIEVELEFLKIIKEAGGMTKYMERLRKEVYQHD